MRGKVPGSASGHPAPRITPAYAGKSRSKWYGTYHPRITPAYAGKSARFHPLLTIPKDHPRVCGEKGGGGLDTRPQQGSPPRMRGKVTKSFQEHGYVRITPAYAGKSVILLSTMYSSGDHPRVCGEKLAPPRFAAKIGGSPPRMRGKDRQTKKTKKHSGITPAYAGKSRRWFPVHRFPWDHPRVCGEKSLWSILIVSV